MFIPYSFFGGEDDQVVQATGGTIYDIWSGSYVWRLHDFTTPEETTTVATFTVNSGSSSDARILLVAAGGTAGQGGSTGTPVRVTRPAGGGGGGVKLFNSQTITTGSYTVTTGGDVDDLGSTGRPGKTGSGSAFVGNAINISTEGGGGGGGGGSDALGIPPTDGLNGGSGGGAGATKNPGSGTIVGGFNGGNDAFVSNVWYGGGGGGSAEAGGNAGGGKGGDGGNGKQIRLSPYMTLDYYGGGGPGGGSLYPGQAGSGSYALPRTRNNMGDPNELGGGGFLAKAGKGVVRIMYPLYQYNPADTQTYRFNCTDVGGCTIQYVTPNGILVDGEALAASTQVDKTVPRNSQARITRADGTSGGTITKLG
jgi:hypothetical protein